MLGLFGYHKLCEEIDATKRVLMQVNQNLHYRYPWYQVGWQKKIKKKKKIRTSQLKKFDLTSSSFTILNSTEYEFNQEFLFSGGACKSAQFRTSKALSINNTLGRCALSMVERSIRPQAYRASMYRDEYLQHQCHDIRE